jgi:hypothetical protein
LEKMLFFEKFISNEKMSVQWWKRGEKIILSEKWGKNDHLQNYWKHPFPRGV